MLIALTTTPNSGEAERLANAIVTARLGACVQVLPQLTSIYIWEGKTQRESECLLLIKTLPEKWDELREFISVNHSYDVPEIVAIDAKAAEPYLAWLTTELRSEMSLEDPSTDK